jgi:hypothetical protein
MTDCGADETSDRSAAERADAGALLTRRQRATGASSADYANDDNEQCHLSEP